MITAISSKNTQGYCQSICCNLPLHTHDEDHFHHPQILKLASGTHIEWILNRNKNKMKFIKKLPKTITKTECSITKKFTIHTSYKPKNWNVCLTTKLCNLKRKKEYIKKLQPIRKGPFQIFDKTTDVTYIPIDSNKKEIVQHRNNLFSYYPKEHALCELR